MKGASIRMDEKKSLKDILTEEMEQFTDQEKLAFQKIINMEDAYLSAQDGHRDEMVKNIVQILKGLYN